METGRQKTDEELALMSRTQREFFGMLIERYDERLARYIRRLGVRDEDDIADVLQEIFIKVYRNLNEFDTSLSFSSWIYRIAHNEAVSFFRKKSVRPEGNLVNDSEALLPLLEDDHLGAEERFDRVLNAKEVAHALGTLSAKYRDIIVLRFFEHKEYNEISDILQIPIGSVGTRIHRAKHALEKCLQSTKTHTP